MTLSRTEITDILGPVGDTIAAAIAATGASQAELARAWAWVHSDEAMVNAGESLPTGRVAALVDLLDPPDDDEAVLVPSSPLFE